MRCAHRRREPVDGELDRDVDAERTRGDAAAPFAEVAAAVQLIGLNPADAAHDERVRAEAPAGRAIAHVDADAEIRRAAVRQLVGGRRRGPVNATRIVGMVSMLPRTASVAPDARSERIHRRPDRRSRACRTRRTLTSVCSSRVRYWNVSRWTSSTGWPSSSASGCLANAVRLDELRVERDADEMPARLRRLIGLLTAAAFDAAQGRRLIGPASAATSHIADTVCINILSRIT